MANSTEVKRRTGGANTCSRQCWYKYMPIVLKEKWDSTGRLKSTLYTNAHKFIYQKRGKATICEICGVKDRPVYHWANISGFYLHDIKDWKQMCPSCHKLHDLQYHKINGTRMISNLKSTKVV
jgi:hypothetical protein